MTTAQIYRGIEEIVVPEIERDETLEKLVKHLNRFKFDYVPKNTDHNKIMRYLPMLNPSQITMVSRIIKKRKTNWVSSAYLEKLIQLSFNENNNDFIIDNPMFLQEMPLFGEENRQLKIKFLSSINRGAYGFYYCNTTYEENVNFIGVSNEHNDVEIKGNVHMLFLDNSRHTTYKIHGKVKKIKIMPSAFGNKIILNSEEYRKYEYLKGNKESKLEILQ